MRTLILSFRYLWSRPLQAVLNLLLLTLGLGSICFVVLVTDQVGRSFKRDLAGIDLVVGAKGSPMQLILAGVFNMDDPPGNIPLPEVQALRQHPLVAQVIPMSLGDTFRGFRIVGTTADYLTHYRARIAQGQAWVRPMEVVLGAQVAQTSGMVLNDTFFGTHGLGRAGTEHTGAGTMYRVKGILAPCGCVADRLILTAPESVWQIHEPLAKPPEPSPDGMPPREPVRELTMALVVYKNAEAATVVPRFVNSSTTMQAAAPAAEVSQLLRLLGVGTEVLRGMGAVLLLTGALSVFIALWSAVRERREDLGMLRMLGATSWKVASLLLAEALWLALLASALGLVAGHALTALAGHVLEARHSLPLSGLTWVPAEGWIPVAALIVAMVAALIPSVTAYRIDVAQMLNGRR